MTVRFFLLSTSVTALISGAIWALIIMWLDPIEAGWAGFLLFFLALFLMVASVAALLGYAVRALVQMRVMSAYRVRPSLRQGVWLGIFFDLLLFLQLQRLLRWWIAVILIVLFVTIELVFLSYDSANRRIEPGSDGSA